MLLLGSSSVTVLSNSIFCDSSILSNHPLSRFTNDFHSVSSSSQRVFLVSSYRSGTVGRPVRKLPLCKHTQELSVKPQWTHYPAARRPETHGSATSCRLTKTLLNVFLKHTFIVRLCVKYKEGSCYTLHTAGPTLYLVLYYKMYSEGADFRSKYI